MCFIKRTALVGVALLMLSACGQRGPLYLPADEPAANQPSTQSKDDADSSENSKQRDTMMLPKQTASNTLTRGTL